MSREAIPQFDPKATMDTEAFLRYEQEVTNPHLLPWVLELITRPGLKILDVGGASGVLLHEIMATAKHTVEPSNLELMAEYRDEQIDDSIRFVEGSILVSNIPDDSYDIVVFRHILHHLVADSVQQTLDNQQKGLDEMFRILKPGGCLVFEEEVNRRRRFSRIVYHLSKSAHRLRLKSRYYEGAGSVVVSFLSPPEIATMLEKADPLHDLHVLKHRYDAWTMPLRWKLTLLMADVGSLLYVVRVGETRRSP